jgi:hypothetical protein
MTTVVGAQRAAPQLAQTFTTKHLLLGLITFGMQIPLPPFPPHWIFHNVFARVGNILLISQNPLEIISLPNFSLPFEFLSHSFCNDCFK